jgi:hypothetical protein
LMAFNNEALVRRFQVFQFRYSRIGSPSGCALSYHWLRMPWSPITAKANLLNKSELAENMVKNIRGYSEQAACIKTQNV